MSEKRDKAPSDEGNVPQVGTPANERQSLFERYGVQVFLGLLFIFVGLNTTNLFSVNRKLGELTGISEAIEELKQGVFRLESKLMGGLAAIPTPTTTSTVTFLYYQESLLLEPGDEPGVYFGPGLFIADDLTTWTSGQGIIDVANVTVEVWNGDLVTEYAEIFGSPCGETETGEYTALQARRADYDACPTCTACAVYLAFPTIEGELAGSGFVLPRHSVLRAPLAIWLSEPRTVEIFQVLGRP